MAGARQAPEAPLKTAKLESPGQTPAKRKGARASNTNQSNRPADDDNPRERRQNREEGAKEAEQSVRSDHRDIVRLRLPSGLATAPALSSNDTLPNRSSPSARIPAKSPRSAGEGGMPSPAETAAAPLLPAPWRRGGGSGVVVGTGTAADAPRGGSCCCCCCCCW